MHLSLSIKDSLDSHPIYTLPHECAKSIRRSFLRTGHVLSLSLRRKRSMEQTTFTKAGTPSRRASMNSTLSTSSTNTSSSHGAGSYPVPSASSSFTQLSDLTVTTTHHESTIATPSPPTNHPPAHVFGKADQGYSMFYLKLPNGNWMVRCRTADRKIIATYEVDGSMI